MPTTPVLPATEAAALRSVHTSNLPGLFEQLQISLVVSTYQAGKVILVRKDGSALNTHFRTFTKPMGIAADHNRLTIGGANTVWDYRNMPAVAQKMEPVGKHDACYIPRRVHVTGDIDIHEMAYAENNELWAVNTRFCCLCTFDADHSFVPRWRPPFVSALAPEDRCHLNGLCLIDGRPKYVTALGNTDTAGGWRANKASGGLLMDIETNEVVLHGLSMPHSPRWYQNKLWILESGQGTLALVDRTRGTWDTVAQVPGFTRGLDFYGPLAFIGLSQVRESATFSGIPLVQRLKERTCGVWIVHIETGQTVGFLRFETGVQEIFAVQVLRGIRFPELLEWNDERLSHSYVLPDAALKEVVLPTAEQMAQSPAFHFQRAMGLYQKGQIEEAITAFRQCVVLQPEFPNARYNLGVALGDAEQYVEAMDHLQHVVAAEPERAEAYNSLGYLLSRQRQPQQAIPYYEQAIELQPQYAQAHFNLGMTLLQLGNYPRGFTEYDWRWRTGQFTPFQCPHPQWDGSPIPDKTLLIHTEQGAGDAIQFARYLPLAAQRCKKLILVCRGDLIPLFSTLSGIAQIREAGTITVAEFDTYLPLLSLPRVFGTTLETIPAKTPYLDVQTIRRRKAEASAALSLSSYPKVGLVWAGSPTYKNDRHRSCPVLEWTPVLQVPGVEFYSLQKGPQRDELAQLPADVRVQDLDAHLHDYGDTAVIVDALDLVITVDTSVAHLAGALGKSVWTLLPYVPDWRWGLEGEATPWYPTMRLFRQTRPRDWAEVLERVAQALSGRRQTAAVAASR
ncbi:MAG: TIGR03032 family protein [Deltaproteobacteria bacterium]|nr:TIGR03032 family protein [Deltaproteobacteria bacterium]